ncbi:MAG TPA: hypothetical protein VLQ48_07285 [Chloroflexia bacterium]|nr:hypothetical protein [Chloroflexia bacterium]
MNMDYPNYLRKLEWLVPWCPVDSELDLQLKKEVGWGHPLYVQKAIAVGRRSDSDDVLFYLPDYSAPLAVVHLTWSDAPGPEPMFPWTVVYSSLEEWVDQCMKPDYVEYARGR